MRRALALAVGLAAATGTAVAAPRDGYLNQTVINTVAKSLDRRGVDPTVKANTLAKVSAEITHQANATAAPYPKIWYNALKPMAAALTADGPSPFGKRGTGGQSTVPPPQSFPTSGTAAEKETYCRTYVWPQGEAWYDPAVEGCTTGGDFGGGGGQGSGWVDPASGSDGGVRDCGDMGFAFAADGSFIVPSYQLMTGQAIIHKNFPTETPDNHFAYSTPVPGTSEFTQLVGSNPNQRFTAKTQEAVALWVVHKWNMSRDKRDWMGVIGWSGGLIHFGSIARAGVGRVGYATAPNTGYHHGPNDCPGEGSGGGFHFYGNSNGATISPPSHTWVNCTWYAPNTTLGLGGYAINTHTSVTFDQNYLTLMRPWQLACGLDPEFIRRLSEELLQRASERAGYDGAPMEPVDYEDVRGDPTVEDLKDDPTTGPQPTTPNEDVNNPPPAQPPNQPGTSTGFQDECDFGEGGCTAPNSSDPTLDDPETGFMDVWFDWLPDLPSLTIDTNTSECPNWAVNLTEWTGTPDAQWLIDAHCDLVDGSGEQQGARPLISALMLAVFGIAALRRVLQA